MVKRPTTPIGLLENLKFALDNNLLLREDFFTEENLKNFFGGSKFSWRQNDKNGSSVDVSNFSEMFEPRVINGVSYAVGEFFCGREVKPDGKVEAGARLDISPNTGPIFEDVERIFNFSGKYRTGSDLPSPHKVFQPPTRPHGNEQIEYKFDNAKTTGKVSMEFGPNATLIMAFLKQEEK